MPSKVYNNVEDHRLLDGNTQIEDVTKVGLPTIKHTTTTIDASGMAMSVDMPNTTHIDAMDYSITHNNGVNCEILANPGKHTQEFRTVRQRYNVAKGEIEHESVKYRLTGVHVETQKGDIETGSPFGSTDKYSCLRYEEIVNGKTTILIDATAGIIKYNGKSFTDAVQNMLK
ncbi:MAG: phage major tail tube protein [Lachnospiraceae bacterium]|nr:phage major tail tube protein [Lachnospiraceae bacterium]